MQDFGLTQEELADRVGKERATVANYLRLLKLPDEIKALLYEGSLSMGHARALLAIEGRAAQVEAAKKILKSGLSVREAESMAKKAAAPSRIKQVKDAQIASLEEKLIKHLGTKARLVHKGKKGGRIEIEYYSLDELDRILEILMA
jgi:ParB family chromosome partitioning protein